MPAVCAILALALVTPVLMPLRPVAAYGQGPWKLVWGDEFNGPNGSPADPTKWTYDTGGAWGGGAELQYYTDRTVNAYLQNGNLVIKAMKEYYLGNAYTSARLYTQGKFTQRYGRFEARIKIPGGQGIWPAFWMVGANISQVGWPACGEIDILEHINYDIPVVETLHMPDASGRDAPIGNSYTLPNNADPTADYHVYAAEWEPDVIRFYVDGALTHTITRSNLAPGRVWSFDHPFYLILNIAVGGTWPGYPDASTVFPVYMYVDYVRVYMRNNAQAFIPAVTNR